MAQSGTEQSFRANLSQFRWARGNNDDSQVDDAPSNPFSRFYHAIGGGYIPLRSNERSNDEEAYFALSRWDRYVLNQISFVLWSPMLSRRLLGFGGCLLGAMVCFFVAFLTLPMLPVRPMKFALAFRCVSPSIFLHRYPNPRVQPRQLTGYVWVRSVFLKYVTWLSCTAVSLS